MSSGWRVRWLRMRGRSRSCTMFWSTRARRWRSFWSHGLTSVELAALQLLTRMPEEAYEAHVLRIAHGRGLAGALARRVKCADLKDHVARHPDRVMRGAAVSRTVGVRPPCSAL